MQDQKLRVNEINCLLTLVCWAFEITHFTKAIFSDDIDFWRMVNSLELGPPYVHSKGQIVWTYMLLCLLLFFSLLTTLQTFRLLGNERKLQAICKILMDYHFKVESFL